MFRKMKFFIIVGVILLATLACSLSKQKIEPRSSNSNIESTNPDTATIEQTASKTEPTPEETQYSPGQGRILYSDSDGLYFYDVATSQSSQIVSGVISDAMISPDGRYLAYLEKSPDPEKWMVKTLRVMSLETNELTTTSSVPDDINAFTWYKDSKTITYSRKNHDYCTDFVDRQISGLYQFNLASDETKPLHIGTDQYVFRVQDWSPDGRYLLFSHAPDCSEGQSLLYFDSQTGEVNGVPFAEATWSPSEGLLAGNGIWYWEPEELPLIQYQILTGEKKELFFQQGYYVSSPAWSPDGKWIAFAKSSIGEFKYEPSLLNYITNETRQIPLPQAKPELWCLNSDLLILSINLENFEKDIYIYDLNSQETRKILSSISGQIFQWVS